VARAAGRTDHGPRDSVHCTRRVCDLTCSPFCVDCVRHCIQASVPSRRSCAAEKWSSGATTPGRSTPRARARAILGIDCIGVCALRISLLAGATKRFDHCCIVHALWEHFMKLNMNVWVDRVPTKENIADNPSRFFKALCFAFSHVLRALPAGSPTRSCGT